MAKKQIPNYKSIDYSKVSVQSFLSRINKFPTYQFDEGNDNLLSEYHQLLETTKELFRFFWSSLEPSLPQTFPIAPLDEPERSDFYLQLLVDQGDDSFGEEIGVGKYGTREVLEADIGSIYDSIKWCFVYEPRKAVQIVERITTFLGDTGRRNEQVNLCLRALRVTEHEGMLISQIGLSARLGWSSIVTGAYSTAEQYLNKAKTIIENIEPNYLVDPKQTDYIYKRYIQVLRDLGHLYALQHKYEQSFQLIQQSKDKAGPLKEDLPNLQASLFQAWTYCIKGEAENNLPSYSIAQDILAGITGKLENHPRQLVLALRLQGDIAIAQKLQHEAEQYLSKATQIISNYRKAEEYIGLTLSWGNYYRSLDKNLIIAHKHYQLAQDLAMMWGMEKDAEHASRLIIVTASQFSTINLESLDTSDILTGSLNATSATNDENMVQPETSKSEQYTSVSKDNTDEFVGIKDSIVNDWTNLSPEEHTDFLKESTEETIQVGGTEYPKWVVEQAKAVIEKHGGSLLSTIQSVVMFTEAKKKGTPADPKQPGRAITANISRIGSSKGRK